MTRYSENGPIFERATDRSRETALWENRNGKACYRAEGRTTMASSTIAGAILGTAAYTAPERAGARRSANALTSGLMVWCSMNSAPANGCSG